MTCVKQLFRSQFSAWSSPTRPKKLLIVSRYHTRSFGGGYSTLALVRATKQFFLFFFLSESHRFLVSRYQNCCCVPSAPAKTIACHWRVISPSPKVWFDLCARTALFFIYQNVLTPYSNGVWRFLLRRFFFCGTNSKSRMEEWNFKFFKLSFYPKKSSQNCYIIYVTHPHTNLKFVSEKAFSSLAIGSGLLRHRKSPPSKPYKKTNV